ncbi:hypothetical protein ACF0H5_012474 [Mactra antiquata]
MSYTQNTDDVDFNTNSSSSRQITFVSRQIKELKSWNFWRAVIAEYVGTFMLFAWSIGIGVHDKDEFPPHLLEVAIGTGFIVAAIINALLTVSGGHVNPVVSIGFLVNGHITIIRFIIFVIIQCLASISVVWTLGQLSSADMVGNVGLLQPGVGVTPIQACIVECILAFGLHLTITAFADGDRQNDVPPGPMYVGLVVVANILFGARISGGCFNPARNFGPAVISGNFKNQWVYWVGPLSGGVLGALLYDKMFSVKAMSRSTFSSCCGRKSRGSASDEGDNEFQEVLMTEKPLNNH